MTFESLVLMTMAEEHLANSRPNIMVSESEMSGWKPLKVYFSFLIT